MLKAYTGSRRTSCWMNQSAHCWSQPAPWTCLLPSTALMPPPVAHHMLFFRCSQTLTRPSLPQSPGISRWLALLAQHSFSNAAAADAVQQLLLMLLLLLLWMMGQCVSATASWDPTSCQLAERVLAVTAWEVNAVARPCVCVVLTARCL